MKNELQIVPIVLLKEYLKRIPKGVKKAFDALKDVEISTKTFSFYTSVSAITSSRIEGEQMEVDSYIKHRMLNIEYQPALVQKPDDLYKAYLFAQKHTLTKTNFLKAHTVLSAHLLPKSKQGVYRKGNMVVMEHKTGKIQYEAVHYSNVAKLHDMLWDDIARLKKQKLNHAEVFYFASFIHIIFENIHPFEDGNGRAGRLLEKWFIATKLGKKAWFIQSELNYYKNINSYYKNLNNLGIFYEKLDYTKALPFLLMLPNALEHKNYKG